jgi:arylsulfatase A-like enzyme/Flp pilus assembly protein TadD
MAKKRKKKKKRRGQKPLAQISQQQERKDESPPIPKSKKPKRKRVLLFALSLVLLAAAVFLVLYLSYTKEKILKDGSLNVLLITLDTTRADRLGCYGYPDAQTPNLDFLATNGIQFLNAYCQVPLTCPSHCSILTGTYPMYHQVRNNGTYYLAPEIQTLAEVLKTSGLETSAFVSSFTVDSRFGLDQGFDVYDDLLSPDQTFKALNSERRADAVYASFSRWLDEREDGRFFSWVHFFDPHIPYDPPSHYGEEFAENPYDGEIAFMDFYVGKILEKLRAEDLLEKTLIVVAGDHGEAFGEKQEKGHGVFIYESTMRVPLIFYAPINLPQGQRIEARARLIDIMPSILDFLNIPVTEDIQGVSLLPHMEGRTKADLSSYIESFYPRENYGWSQLVGLIDGDWKYIKAPKQELYNLEQDPWEETNLILDEVKVAQEIKEKLEALIEESISQRVAEKRSLSSEERERLRSLGYIATSETSSGDDLPDPKDHIQELLLIQKAQDYEMGGKFAEAASIYEEILVLRPDVATSYINLALMKAQMMEFDETIRILEQGLEKIPESEILLSRLGHTFMLMGRVKRALETFDLILKNNPRYFDALLGSAWMLDLIGQKDDAQAYYRSALEVEPENKFARKNYANSLAATQRLNQAIEIYLGLKKDYPEDPEILQDLGIALGYVGDISQSIENLEKAASFRPNPVVYYNLAVAKKKVGNLEEAVRYLRLYLENPEGENEESISRARAELQNLERRLKKKL